MTPAVKWSSAFLVIFLAVVALLLGTAEARSYGVNSLSESLCHFAQRVDYDVGDDRSPVVVGSKGVVGDGGTGSFSSSNLTLQVSTETTIDGLFSDLGNGHLWTFGTSSSTWLQADGNGELSPGTMLTHLIPLVADADGNLARDASRHVVALSTALNPYWNEYPLPMLFLGMGELVFTSSFKAPSAFAGAFHVDIASGKVTLIHEMADGQVWTTDTPVEGTENWAASGVMERRGDTIKLLAANPNWAVDQYQGGVYRYHLNGTFHSKLYTGYLDDAATFTVNYWSNHNKRWFAHAQGAPTNADGTPRPLWSGASTMSCAVCSLVSALWSSLFF